ASAVNPRSPSIPNCCCFIQPEVIKLSRAMKRIFTFIGIPIVLAAVLISSGCARPNPRESLAAVQGRATEGSPMLLAIYQPWFGQKDHINVGYSCHDP